MSRKVGALIKKICDQLEIYMDPFLMLPEMVTDFAGAFYDHIEPEYCRLRSFKPSWAKLYQFIRFYTLDPQPEQTIYTTVKGKKYINDLNFLDPPDFVEEPHMPFIIADLKKLRTVKNRGNYPKTVQLVCLMFDGGVPIVAFHDQSPKYIERVSRRGFARFPNRRH